MTRVWNNTQIKAAKKHKRRRTSIYYKMATADYQFSRMCVNREKLNSRMTREAFTLEKKRTVRDYVV